MRRGFRGVFIACAVLFSLGLVLCIISVVGGVDIGDIHVGKRYKGEVEAISQTYTEPVSSLDLQVNAGQFTIKHGNEFKIEGSDIPKGSLKCSVENGVLKVKDDVDGERGIHIDLFHFDIGSYNVHKQVTLTIPDNMTFDSVKIRMAAGKTSLTDLTAKKAELYMEAGHLEATNLTVLDSTKLNMDAGAMELRESSVNNTDVEVNAGGLTIDGKVLGKTKAEVNAGGMEIRTDLEESEYDFDADSSFGRVKINGHSSKDIRTHKDAKNEMKLECNAGSIKVETK